LRDELLETSRLLQATIGYRALIIAETGDDGVDMLDALLDNHQLFLEALPDERVSCDWRRVRRLERFRRG
jgi:hypothetical protein